MPSSPRRRHCQTSAQADGEGGHHLQHAMWREGNCRWQGLLRQQEGTDRERGGRRHPGCNGSQAPCSARLCEGWVCLRRAQGHTDGRELRDDGEGRLCHWRRERPADACPCSRDAGHPCGEPHPWQGGRHPPGCDARCHLHRAGSRLRRSVGGPAEGRWRSVRVPQEFLPSQRQGHVDGQDGRHGEALLRTR